MEKNNKVEQPKNHVPESQETGEPEPRCKDWKQIALKMLYSLRDWFLKLRTSYKIIVVIFTIALLVLILLAYLGVFGQEISALLKQLVDKILEQLKQKKS